MLGRSHSHLGTATSRRTIRQGRSKQYANIRGESAHHSGLLLLRSADQNTAGSATRRATQGGALLGVPYYHSQTARYCLFVLPSLWMGTKPPANHSLRSLVTHCRLRVQTIQQSKKHLTVTEAVRLRWDSYVSCNNNQKY